MDTCLSAEQRLIVESNSTSILVPATAGSGKTHTLLARVRHLVDSGVDPRGIIVIPFTNAAVNTIQERLGSLKLGHLSTLHSFCFKLIRQHYPEASVLDEESTDVLLDKIVADMRYRGTKTDLFAYITLGIPILDNPPSLLSLVASEFYKTMMRSQSFSYDALLFVAFDLIQQHNWNSDNAFTHCFIDEVQDCSNADFDIFDAMNVANWYWTGDDNQAVYGFRGGNVRRMLNLSYNVTTLPLQTCYRSDKAICEAADTLILHNVNRIPKLTIPHSTAYGTVSVRSFDTADSELLGLAQSIRDQQESGTPLKEIAVLVRTNNLVSHFSEGLKAFSIAVCERSEASLPEDWKRTMLLLSVITSPNNDFLMKRWMEGVEEDATAVNAIAIQARVAFKSINRMTVNWPDNPPAARALGRLVVNGLSQYSHDIINVALATLPPDATASDLLMELRSNPPMATEGDKDGVTVCTVHRSKGMEFDSVFLPAFEDEIIPGHKEEQISEERRIAYVALTRARHFIGISWSEQRTMPWRPGIQFHHPSRFITECVITT